MSRAEWEDVRAPVLRVGDEIPAGRVVAMEYFALMALGLEIADGREVNCGWDQLVSRRRRTV